MPSDTRFVPEIRRGLPDLVRNDGGRNSGLPIADGSAMAQIANFSLSLVMRRRRVLAQMANAFNSYFASGITHRLRFYLEGEENIVYGYSLYCAIQYADSGVAGAAGLASLNVNGVSQLASFTDPSNTGTASLGPSGVVCKIFSLGGGFHGVNTLDFSVDANSAINSIVVFGGIISDGSGDNGSHETSWYKAGTPISYASIYGLYNNVLQSLWRHAATPHFTWSGSRAVATTTYTNILDATTTGYASGAAGFYAIPESQATLTGTTVPCLFWVYASSTGTTGRVRISNSTGVLATITGIAAGGYYTTTVNLDPSVSSDLLVVEASEATAAKTVTVSGAGLYSFIA